ncbi:hypothetical protein Prudu_001588 [Prunus dulcis]|uniref:Uncharacterized protein n=1 Tax=Prunus dulcis TaxID=3755 RepID=A0A4Y1QNV9_PRUDU|nr:hypothetical protein Prudu_001588 [Prunus dulcis]
MEIWEISFFLIKPVFFSLSLSLSLPLSPSRQLEKTSRAATLQATPTPTQATRPSGPDPAAPVSSRHQPQPIRRPCCCLELLETAGNAAVLADFPTSVSPSSGHQISRMSCLMSFGDARTVSARIADQADYGLLIPARKFADQAEIADQADYGLLNPARIAARIHYVPPRPARGSRRAQESTTRPSPSSHTTYKMGDSAEFSAGVQRKFKPYLLAGRVKRSLCPTFARCRTRTVLGSNSKVEIGSGRKEMSRVY